MKINRIITRITTALLLAGISVPSWSQSGYSGYDGYDETPVRDEDTLNYTYAGPVLSTGFLMAEYTDWFDDENRTKTEQVSGIYFSGGAAFFIFAKDFCGDLQLRYAYNSLDFSLMYLEGALSVKYLYPFNSTVSAGGGLGLFFALPPSNMDYNGSAGIMIPLTAVFNTTETTKLFIEAYAGYGSFGIGEDTSSILTGINLGFVFKVGRI